MSGCFLHFRPCFKCVCLSNVRDGWGWGAVDQWISAGVCSVAATYDITPPIELAPYYWITGCHIMTSRVSTGLSTGRTSRDAVEALLAAFKVFPYRVDFEYAPFHVWKLLWSVFGRDWLLIALVVVNFMRASCICNHFVFRAGCVTVL